MIPNSDSILQTNHLVLAWWCPWMHESTTTTAGRVLRNIRAIRALLQGLTPLPMCWCGQWCGQECIRSMSGLSHGWEYHHHPALSMRDYGSTCTKDGSATSSTKGLILLGVHWVSEHCWTKLSKGSLKSGTEWLGEPAEPMIKGSETWAKGILEHIISW